MNTVPPSRGEAAPYLDAADIGVDDLTIPPRRARHTLRVAMIGIIALVTWAAFSKIDQVTRAQAQVIASARTQVIQSVDLGVVTRLHVREGDEVTAGQLLVTLEKARAEAAVDDSQSKLAALRAALVRLRAEVYGEPLVFEAELMAYPEYVRNQRALYERRKQAIDEDVASLRAAMDLAKQELDMNQKLVATGDVSLADVLRLKRMVAEIQAQIANKRNKFFQDAQAEMTKAQEDLNTQVEQVRDRKQVLEHTELTAPLAGQVKNIQLTTVGAVAKPGDVVMEIVPTGEDLIVEAKISTSDIAFVEVGQTASVKLDAYDYSIFGTMKGEVFYVSPDTLEENRQGKIEPYYRVQIRIRGKEFSKGGDVKIRPGMTASVDIKAMERTVLSYLTKPITKTLSQSMGER
ncbi:HlyD family type I secretion periplasmic adaptor subunit [Acidovorax sp. sic0104]|uniref:HlyD family type I secretion periplasmic adaptor subunit n=1 Tax=Acidovorax sp. sic0104 TaxID=2854784 RepID=UPI001C465E44|nr:HlyD family type I secretion periplasmic adaptor subunit [Acidovorax sp. sic0104]MBV7540300.1 HlyD family type I secretion periplasmic adaptor subunit [Acidovorax sp. sic0104]